MRYIDYLVKRTQGKKEMSGLVRMRGVEPPRPCGHYHLKVACIPFHHIRLYYKLLNMSSQAAVPARMCPERDSNSHAITDTSS